MLVDVHKICSTYTLCSQRENLNENAHSESEPRCLSLSGFGECGRTIEGFFMDPSRMIGIDHIWSEDFVASELNLTAGIVLKP